MGEEALKRYLKLKPPSFVPNRQEVVHDIRKTVGGAICDPEDLLKTVLDDNDFVSIGKLKYIHSARALKLEKKVQFQKYKKTFFAISKMAKNQFLHQKKV